MRSVFRGGPDAGGSGIVGRNRGGDLPARTTRVATLPVYASVFIPPCSSSSQRTRNNSSERLGGELVLDRSVDIIIKIKISRE